MKDTRTTRSRAAQAISGAVFDKVVTIRYDPDMVKACEQAGIFHRGRKDKDTPSLQQWLYNEMARALQETKKE